MSYFTTRGGPSKEQQLISHHQPEEFGKGQKETPHVRSSFRILLPDIHLGWATCTPPGRTLSQNNWPKTTWKVIPHYHNAWDCEPCGRAVLLGSLTLLLSGGLGGRVRVLFPIKSLALSACVSPWTYHFQVLDKSPLWGPGRGFPSCNTSFPDPWPRKKFSRAVISESSDLTLHR